MRRILAGATVAAALVVSGVLGTSALGGEDFTLFPEGIGGATDECASGKLATGGGFKSASGRLWVIDATKPVKRGWKVTLANASEMPQTATVKAVCASKSKFKVVRRRSDITNVGFGSIKSKCPRGMTIAGGGFDLDGGVTESVSAFESRPKGNRRWLVGYNVGSPPSSDSEIRAYAVCDRNGAHYAARSDTVDAAPPRALRGTYLPFKAKAKCKPGEARTGGGYASDDVNVRYDTLSPIRRGFKASGQSYGGDPITSVALCRK